MKKILNHKDGIFLKQGKKKGRETERDLYFPVTMMKWKIGREAYRKYVLYEGGRG